MTEYPHIERWLRRRHDELTIIYETSPCVGFGGWVSDSVDSESEGQPSLVAVLDELERQLAEKGEK